MERLRRTCFTLVSLTVPYRPLPRLPLSVSPYLRPSIRRMSTIRSPSPTQGVADAFKIPSHFRALPEVPGTDPKRRVMDAFRIAIAQFLTEALPGLTIEKAIEGVDYGRKEDFMVALPRFRLPEKPAESAQKVISKVCIHSPLPLQCAGNMPTFPAPLWALACPRTPAYRACPAEGLRGVGLGLYDRTPAELQRIDRISPLSSNPTNG